MRNDSSVLDTPAIHASRAQTLLGELEVNRGR